MEQSESRPIRVAAIGMDERMKYSLRFFFQGQCKNLCVLVEEESAEICLIDMDGYGGKEILTNYRKRYPGQPHILMSLHDTKSDEGLFLRKPIKPTNLMKALAEAKLLIQSSDEKPPETSTLETLSTNDKGENEEKDQDLPNPIEIKTRGVHPSAPDTHSAAMYLEEKGDKILIGTSPDIDPDNTKQLARAQYQPDDFLQGHLHQGLLIADNKSSDVHLDTPRGSITIYSGTHRVETDITESRMKTLSTVPLDDVSVTVSILKHTEPKSDTKSTLDNREKLLWKTAIWASRGRVPEGTSLSTPVFLRRWPNMTRLLLFPHALRITALWANHPRSLLDTARILAIPQRYVFGLYSAIHAVGLADISERNVDTLVEPESLPVNRKRNLFSRIISRLRKN